MGRPLRALFLGVITLSCDSSTGPDLTIATLQGSWQQVRCEAIAVADSTVTQLCTNGREVLYIAPTGGFELSVQTLPGEDSLPRVTGHLIGTGRNLRAVYSAPPADTAHITYDRQNGTHAWTIVAVFRFEPPAALQSATVTVTYAQHTR